MVSVARETVLVCFSIHYLFSINDWCQIHPNSNPQSAIKPDMKMELRMEGAVNGHKFVITGKGTGQPFEWVMFWTLLSFSHLFRCNVSRIRLQPHLIQDIAADAGTVYLFFDFTTLQYSVHLKVSKVYEVYELSLHGFLPLPKNWYLESTCLCSIVSRIVGLKGCICCALF